MLLSELIIQLQKILSLEGDLPIAQNYPDSNTLFLEDIGNELGGNVNTEESYRIVDGGDNTVVEVMIQRIY